ncbi:MAG: tetratricopeptide repeat protein, partial [Solirubrobacterales bacterium]
ALGEIMRGWFEIGDGEEASAALDKLTRGIEALQTEPEADSARSAMLIGRLLGFDLREDRSAVEDPEEVRERIFAAVRSVLQLISEQRPLLLAIEDIHWADDGTLDLIEHLAGVGRGRMLIVCMTRDELLTRRPGWGGGRRNATTITLEPLTPEETEQLVRTLFDDADESGIAAEVAGRSGGNPLFAEEIVNRLNEEGSDSIDELPDSVHAVLAARLDSLDGEERRLIQAASVVGQSFWEQTVGELSGGGPITKPLATLVEKDLLVPSSSSRLADEREFAFKHALVRDVAYSKLPRAIRARKHFEVASIVERRSEGNGETTAGLLAEHYGRAATLGEQSDFPDEELVEMRFRAGGAYERAGDVAASLYSNGEALSMYDNALQLRDGLSAEIRARVEEKRGDTAFRSGQVDAALEAWERALDYQRDNHQRERAGGLHRKIGSGLWHKGSREASIAQFQQGIDLLKDGDACSELVELYEEAASLYVETGDNMLAIYAAEKAQRLAEDLGESSTASRAHLTFGRVFGRIGDLEQARRSLERSVELAREASPSEAVRALLALGRHLEVAEADYPAAAATCREALELANQLGDVPAQIELHAALGQLAVNSASWSEVELHAKASADLAEREGLSGQLCLPLLLRGICAWRNGKWEEADEHLRRSHDIAAAGGRSETAFSALLWLATCERDRGNLESAREALVQAADICERAGLIAQSVEATGALVGVLALQGRSQEVTAAAEQVERLGSRGGHPVGKAAAAEARGAVLEDPEGATSELRTAATEWEDAGRPLNALRTRLLCAQRLSEKSPAAAAEELGEIATAAGRLEVPHLAAAARSLVPG